MWGKRRYLLASWILILQLGWNSKKGRGVELSPSRGKREPLRTCAALTGGNSWGTEGTSIPRGPAVTWNRNSTVTLAYSSCRRESGAVLHSQEDAAGASGESWVSHVCTKAWRDSDTISSKLQATGALAWLSSPPPRDACEVRPAQSSQQYWEHWSYPYAFSSQTSAQWTNLCRDRNTGLGLRWTLKPGSAAFLAETAAELYFLYCWFWNNKKWGAVRKYVMHIVGPQAVVTSTMRAIKSM